MSAANIQLHSTDFITEENTMIPDQTAPKGITLKTSDVFCEKQMLLENMYMQLANVKFCNYIKSSSKGVQWLSGRVLDLRLRGRRFEPHRCHCVVVLEQDTFILA